MKSAISRKVSPRVLVIGVGGAQAYLNRKLLEALNEADCSVVRLTESPEELWNLFLFNPDIVIIDRVVSNSYEFYRHYAGYNIPVILVDYDAGEVVLEAEIKGKSYEYKMQKHKQLEGLILMVKDILHSYKEEENFSSKPVCVSEA